ncbi:helix-turn-helix transcriptional regulator [Paenibacillus alba]|nr:helix-turn-helix transcriptional regulator [Paenibacillus alba]
MKICTETGASLIRSNWLENMKNYLDLHFTENIRIEDASRQVGIHRSHVAFVKKFGCSPQCYLQKLRMDKGARLLRESDLSVTEIALSLGYPELYSFTRAFTKFRRRHTELTDIPSVSSA